MSRVRELFEAASALDAGDRDRFLRERCAGDDALRAEVEELLRLDANPSFLGERGLAALRDGFGVVDVPAADYVGPFRILGVLGHGGMGVVYRAEQTEPRREVALKVLAPGLGSAAVRARFALEAEALGRLQHPGIAQILAADILGSGGTSPPFLAMELVRGDALNTWAQRTQPALRERVRLIAEIADAVHHAHQRGVIHRDLKPGNILVDESGRAKVLDFGIARLFDGDGEAAQRTVPGLVLGTLAYMSPEQAGDDPALVDVRSDVYGLAVVGYELLAGALPIDVGGLPVTQALRRICDDPPRPLGEHDHRLRGDLDTMFACALRKEPDRRYDSMSAFADDLRRYLAREPIRARPASAAYVLMRFVQRHALVVVAAVAVVLSLVVALLASISANARIETARRSEELARMDAERREVEARRAEQLKSDVLVVLGEVFGAADPTQNPDALHQSMAARLGVTIAALETRFRDAPETELAVRIELARMLSGRGEFEVAEGVLERARELAAAQEPAQQFEVAMLRASCRWKRGDLDGALQVLDAAAPIAADAPPVERMRIDVLRGHVLARLGRSAEAIALWRSALERVRDDPTVSRSPMLAIVRTSIAGELIPRGEVAEAEALLEQAFDELGDAIGPDAQEVLNLMNTQASLLTAQGDFARADRLSERVLADWTRVFGEDHPDLMAILQNRAVTKARVGDVAGAIDALERAIAFGERVFGSESPELAVPIANLGTIRWQQQALDEAAVLYLRAIDIRERHRPTPDKQLSGYYYDLARIRRDQGDRAQQLALMERSVAVRIAALGAFHPLVLNRRVELADLRLQSGQRAEALAELQAIDAQLVEVLGPGHKATVAAARLRATALLDEGRLDEVPPCIAALRARAAGTPDEAATVAIAAQLEERLAAARR